MQINVTFRHMEPSERVRAYAEEKIGRIKRYLVEPIEVNIVLTTEKFRQIAEVTISSNGLNINASEETEDILSSIDLLADTVEAQIKKQLDKNRRKKGSLKAGGKGNIGSSMEMSSVFDEEETIISETYDPKPIDVEEAVLQLNTTKRDVLVFVNRTTGKISVLYRRRDGYYGLIET
ncbi:MAG: ribosome-associated translation inhibitor RaiA [Syntrophobacterales bacterium]|nr:ribosome-associated translation inhibitor RaiA [Syntrophobacterales bacterium]